MTPDELAELHARAMTLTAGWTAPTLKGFVEAPGSILVVRDGAFALGRVIVDDAELLTIAVDPVKQGQGLGRSCLDAFEAEAARRGAQRVFLEVAAHNTVAVRLYESNGYTQTALRERYYKTPTGGLLDARVMRKALDPA